MSKQELVTEKEKARGDVLFLGELLQSELKNRQVKGKSQSEIEIIEVYDLERFNHYIKLLQKIEKIDYFNMDNEWPNIERILDGLVKGINKTIHWAEKEVDAIGVYRIKDELLRLDLTEIDYLIKKYHKGKQCTIYEIMDAPEQVLTDLKYIISKHKILKRELMDNRTRWEAYCIDNVLPF